MHWLELEPAMSNEIGYDRVGFFVIRLGEKKCFF